MRVAEDRAGVRFVRSRLNRRSRRLGRLFAFGRRRGRREIADPPLDNENMEKFFKPRRADELIDRGVAFLLELVDGRDVLLLAPRLRRAERALVVA